MRRGSVAGGRSSRSHTIKLPTTTADDEEAARPSFSRRLTPKQCKAELQLTAEALAACEHAAAAAAAAARSREAALEGLIDEQTADAAALEAENAFLRAELDKLGVLYQVSTASNKAQQEALTNFANETKLLRLELRRPSPSPVRRVPRHPNTNALFSRRTPPTSSPSAHRL